MEDTEKTADAIQRSRIVRFFRWLFSWRIVRRALIGLVGLITLAALLFTEENWRGKRAWENFKREWEAKGERFDLASIIPKPVPPDQNFAMTPLLAPLLDYDYTANGFRFRDSNAVAYAKSITVGGGKPGGKEPPLGNWQRGEFCDLQAWQSFYRDNTNFPSHPQPGEPAQDVLFALGKYDPAIVELKAASARPYAVYGIHYEENFSALLPQLAVLRSLAVVAELRALANLDAGRNDEALADVKLGFHLGQSLQSEPLLISQLTRIAMLNSSLQPVWEGLVRHRWTEAQLAELERSLTSLDLLADYGRTMRGERAFGNEVLAQYRTGRFQAGFGGRNQQVPRWLVPSGMFYHNQLTINRLSQQFSFPVVDAAAHRVYPEKCDTNAFEVALGRHTPYNVFARLLFPAFQLFVERFARGQTCFDQAATACALERYRLANGKYPETLDVLAPKFIEKLPNDVINGQPLRYRQTGDGRFTLYSVGWNGKDDGGEVVLTKNGSLDFNNGDWVWAYPQK